jgi:hypothetical protein
VLTDTPLAGMVDEAGMDEALAVSRVAMDQYKRIRQDYRQLLGRRAQNVVRTANAPATAKKVRALPFTRLTPIRRRSARYDVTSERTKSAETRIPQQQQKVEPAVGAGSPVNLSVEPPPPQVVVELQQRLEREIQERETESALYNAKLYETEQKESDWYAGLSDFDSDVSRDSRFRWEYALRGLFAPPGSALDTSVRAVVALMHSRQCGVFLLHLAYTTPR